MSTRQHVAIYGAVSMRRVDCPFCRVQALVIDGKMACCDSLAPERETCGVKRETEGDNRRRTPSYRAQNTILADQDHACLYCCQRFGNRYRRKDADKLTKLRINWDHLIPFSYTASCSDEQFVAACQVCNGIKSSTIYKTLDEARADLALKRARKGWPF